MNNTFFIRHSVGSSLSDNRMLEEGFLASIFTDAIGIIISKPANGSAASTAIPFMKDIPIWLALSSALFTRDQDDDDDYQDPDDDEILGTIFPDEDDDFWNDNYDVD